MSKPAKIGAWFAIAVAIATACFIANKSHAATPFPDAASERFSVTVTGSGPDVILIPGLASSAATWDGTVAHLRGHYRLHVLNLAGFAGEPAGANATGDILPAEVEAIDAYIKDNHLKPVIVGHSLGGTLTLMLAKAHPEDASKIVIVDALPYIGLLFGPTATVDMVKPQATAMKAGVERIAFGISLPLFVHHVYPKVATTLWHDATPGLFSRPREVGHQARQIGHLVIDRACRRIAFLGDPVDAFAAVMPADFDDVFDQRTSHPCAARGLGDEQVFEIEVVRPRPGRAVQDEGGEPDRTIAVAGEDQEHGFMRVKGALKRQLGNIRRQILGIEIEIPLPQRLPYRLVIRLCSRNLDHAVLRFLLCQRNRRLRQETSLSD